MKKAELATVINAKQADRETENYFWAAVKDLCEVETIHLFGDSSPKLFPSSC